MPILTRRAIIAAKIETTAGTAIDSVVPGDINLLVMDPKFDPKIPLFERNGVNGVFSRFASIPGARMATLSFKVELRGSGAAGTPPAIGKLLKACGMKETINAGTSVIYNLTSLQTDFSWLTIDLYRDGVRKRLRGAQGSYKYVGKVGEPGMIEFTFTGVFDGASDQTFPASTAFESTLPPTLLSSTFSIVSYAARVSSINIDIGNKVIMRQDINSTDGFTFALITDRHPKGSFDPEDTTVGSSQSSTDWYGRFKSGALGDLTFKHNGGAGNTIAIGSSPLTSPPATVQYASISEGNRDDIATLGIDFNFVRSASTGNDEFEIKFT